MVTARTKPRLPDGVSAVTTIWADHHGRPHTTPDMPVCVDHNGVRTAHRLYGCPHTTTDNSAEPCTNTTWLHPSELDSIPHCPTPGHQGAAYTPRHPDHTSNPLALASRRAVADHLRPAAAAALLATGGLTMQLADLTTPTLTATTVLLPPTAAVLAHRGTRWWLTRQHVSHIRRKANRAGKNTAHLSADNLSPTGRACQRIARRARYAAYTAAPAAAWLATAAWFPPASPATPTLTAVLAAGTTIAGRTWVTWRRSQCRPTPPPTVEATSNDQQRRAAITTTWTTRIANSGPLADVTIHNVQLLPGTGQNWRATLRTPEQRPTIVPNTAAAIAAIAGAYQVGTIDVTIEPDPGDASTAQIWVQQDSPLARGSMWHGPTGQEILDGSHVCGIYADGTPVSYVWWESGAVHDMICGATGSGKSALVKALIAVELNSGGNVISWLIDPQRGQSFAGVRDHVDWFASDIAEARRMLLATAVEMYRRNASHVRAGKETWTVDDNDPLLVVTIDEAHRLANDPVCQGLIEQLLAMARKVGIKLRLITQVPLVSSLGSTEAKDALGQKIIFRTGSSVSSIVAAQGHEIRPHLLPTTWPSHIADRTPNTAGLGYIVTSERVSLMRTHWIGDERHAAGYLANTTPGTLSQAAQDELARAISPVLYPQRHARTEEAATRTVDITEIIPAAAAKEIIDTIDAETVRKPEPPAKTKTSEPPAKVRVGVAAAALTTEPGTTITRQQLATALQGMPPRTLTSAVNALILAGEMTSTGHGTYTMTLAGLASAARATRDQETP